VHEDKLVARILPCIARTNCVTMENKKETNLNPRKESSFACRFEKFSEKVTRVSGSPWAFMAALLMIIIWAVTGPIFHFSETWQLVINTGTTIITFLMVFIIQQSQNKETLSLQLKLNELIAAVKGASNRLISSENLTGEELETLKRFYQQLSERAKTEMDIRATHSIEEAEENTQEKKEEFFHQK
jgi:low affinity Fe/Cu permease